MGWNSTRWTSPTVPVPQIRPIGTYGSTVTGSTVRLKWDLRLKESTTSPTIENPAWFVVTSEYGFSQQISWTYFNSSCSCLLDILGVPLGTHTFTVEARWAPDVKSSASMSITIAP